MTFNFVQDLSTDLKVKLSYKRNTPVTWRRLQKEPFSVRINTRFRRIKQLTIKVLGFRANIIILCTYLAPFVPCIHRVFKPYYEGTSCIYRTDDLTVTPERTSDVRINTKFERIKQLTTKVLRFRVNIIILCIYFAHCIYRVSTPY